jgi:hypothetical protein
MPPERSITRQEPYGIPFRNIDKKKKKKKKEESGRRQEKKISK